MKTFAKISGRGRVIRSCAFRMLNKKIKIFPAAGRTGTHTEENTSGMVAAEFWLSVIGPSGSSPGQACRGSSQGLAGSQAGLKAPGGPSRGQAGHPLVDPDLDLDTDTLHTA